MKHKHIKTIAEFVAEKKEQADLSNIKKGALHKQLGYPEDETIPVKELNKIVKAELDSTVKINGKEHKVTALLKKRANFALNFGHKVNEGFGLNNSKIEDLVKALKKIELPVKSIGDTLSGNVFGTKLKGTGHLFNIKVSKQGYEVLDVDSDEKYPKNVVKEFSNKELPMLLKYITKTYGNGRQVKENFGRELLLDKDRELQIELQKLTSVGDFSYRLSSIMPGILHLFLKNEKKFSITISTEDNDLSYFTYTDDENHTDSFIRKGLDSELFSRKIYNALFLTSYYDVDNRNKVMDDSEAIFKVVEKIFGDDSNTHIHEQAITDIADISFDGKNVTYIKNDFEITGIMRKYHSGRSEDYEFIPDSFDAETEEYWDRNWEDISDEIVDAYYEELGKRFKRGNVSENKETINPDVLYRLTNMHKKLQDTFQATKISRGGFNPSREFGDLYEILNTIRKTTQNAGISITSIVSLLRMLDDIMHIRDTRDIERATEIKKRIYQLFPKVSDEIKNAIEDNTITNESFDKDDELADELKNELKKLDLPVRKISSNTQNDVFGTKKGSIEPLFSIKVHSNGYDVIDVDSDAKYRYF